VSSLETAKSVLEQELQELKERQDEMLTENSAMAEHLETLKSLHAEEKVKLVSTSAQQSKLIDFMQSKAESKTSKWKVRYDGELVMMLVNW
jgi:regulator of replication initiation timing